MKRGNALRSVAAAALSLALCTGPAAAAADPQLCAACHGPDGNSTQSAMPSLAGQPAQAISTQLFQFREGNRKDPRMTPVAKTLSNADMNELARFFARQKPAPPTHRTTPENVAAGRQLAERFNCVQCHGPALTGVQHIPRLAGQQYEYLRTQLRGFKAQTRADLDGNMTSAAQPLSEEDIDVLADYLAGFPSQ